MNYAELLKSYINDSRYTLDELSEMLSKKSISATKQYISKLQNSKTPPASEELNRALAEITGGDPDKLIMAAYIEKAPQQIKDLFERLDDVNEFLDKFIGDIPFHSEGDQPVYFSDLLKIVGPKDKIFIFEQAAKKLLGQKSQVDSEIDLPSNAEPYNSTIMRRVPLLGQIRAGEPVDRIECYEGYTLVDPELLRESEGFALRVKGDSMSGDNILDGYIVIVRSQQEVLPHDIAVVAINRDEATLKRVKIVGDMAMLTPSNPTYEPLLIPAKDIHVIGKVVEIKFRPK